MNTLPTTINEDLSNISKDSQSNPDSSIESPDNLSKVKKNQSKFRNHLKDFFQNKIDLKLKSSSSENQIEDKQTSSFVFRDLFCSKPEIENEEEIKLGIHYSIDFKDVYKQGRKLGEGCVGLVKKVKKLSTGELFAVKIIKTTDPETIYNIKKEFINIVKLDHPNIVKVYELYISEKEGRIYSIMELVKSSEMFQVIKRYGSYSEENTRKIFKQILLAIQYMHTRGCCHRDLKPNNILCNEDGSEVKITDFNVSKFNEKRKKSCNFGFCVGKIKMWTYTGTIAFSAPEILQETEYDESVDMWSAGVVLYTMLCGYQPFNAEYVEDLIELITSNKYEFHPDPWDTISSYAKDLIKRCLTKNPKERITTTDALMHPWIANTKANTNILPQIVFENLRKTMKNLSKRKIDTVHRSKSGDNEEIYESVSEFMDDLNDYQIEKNDEIMEEDERGRRAISYAEDLNDMHFFHFKKMGKKYLSNLALKVKDFKEEEKKQL